MALAVAAQGRFAASAVCPVLDVARSNIAERMAGPSHQRLGRPPQPDDELVAAIKAVIAD